MSFPLAMGEGWDGGGPLGPPPHLNPPPPWGEEVIFSLNWSKIILIVGAIFFAFSFILVS